VGRTGNVGGRPTSALIIVLRTEQARIVQLKCREDLSYMKMPTRFGQTGGRAEVRAAAKREAIRLSSSVDRRSMFRLDPLLCLVARASTPSPALRQAMHLAAQCQAAVHTVPLGAVSLADVHRLVEAEKERMGTSVTVEVHEGLPREMGGALREVERYVEATDGDLVVSDPFPGHGSGAEEAEHWGAALGKQLNCSIFMADACREPDQVNRILVPTDLSPASVNTLKQAVEVADCYEASIVLLHVLEANPYVALTPMDRLSLGATTLSEHRARRRLHRIVKKAGVGDSGIRPHIAFGSPPDQIARFVDENEMDLLVLSSRRTGTDPGRPLGPVADRLLRRLSGPLFLVRAVDPSLSSLEDEADIQRRHSSKGNGSSVSPSG